MQDKVVLISEPVCLQAKELLSRRFQVVDESGNTNWHRQIETAHAVIVRSARLTRETLSRASRLRIIAKHGVGLDNIDTAAARERGIVVTYTPEANAQSVAEHAIALILALARRLNTVEDDRHRGKWLARESYLGWEVQGKTLGIAGYGRVGRALARMCRAAFHTRVLAFDPYITIGTSADDPEQVEDLTDLLIRADIVSLHLPLTPQSRGLIGVPQLKAMKRAAVIINTSRGEVIDEAALVESLSRGEIAGAGLDVFAHEPPDLASVLFRLPNVVATPHIGGLTAEAFERMGITAAEDVRRVLLGENPRFPI